VLSLQPLSAHSQALEEGPPSLGSLDMQRSGILAQAASSQSLSVPVELVEAPQQCIAARRGVCPPEVEGQAEGGQQLLLLTSCSRPPLRDRAGHSLRHLLGDRRTSTESRQHLAA